MHDPFLIIGGTGVVGSLAAQHLRYLHPELPLAIGSRSADKASLHASGLGNAIGVGIDSAKPGLGVDEDSSFSGVAVAASIRSTHAVAFAARRGIPYTSIATQFNEIGPKLAYHINNQGDSVSLIQDTNYAGVVIVAGLEACASFVEVDELLVGVLMDDQDMGGESSVADAGDFGVKEPGIILVDGKWCVPRDGAEKREFTLLDGSRYVGESFPSIDAAELAERTGAKSVRLDFAFGQSPGRVATGVASADVIYEVTGKLKGGSKVTRRAQLSHPKGQTWLTSIGLAVGIESMLGLAGRPTPKSGVYLTSGLISPDHMLERLARLGASFRHEDASPPR